MSDVTNNKMSAVTNIKTITNDLLFPITVKNGENTQQTFTVGTASGWNGDMWIPWVDSASDMWKCISLHWPSKTIYIFQHGDRIWYSWNNDWNQKGELGVVGAGTNSVGGEKALIVDVTGNVKLG